STSNLGGKRHGRTDPLFMGQKSFATSGVIITPASPLVCGFRNLRLGRHTFGPIKVFSTRDPLSFSSWEGSGNAHIGRSILWPEVAASRRRYREPQGRQWQIHVCHAHHCRPA